MINDGPKTVRLHLGYSGERWGYATQAEWRSGNKAYVRSVREVCGSTADAFVTVRNRDWPEVVEVRA